MKGIMVLEYPFKILLFIVVILTVISLVIFFRNQIFEYFNLCEFFPNICQQQGECLTVEQRESVIDGAALTRYCDSCWKKTGDKSLGEDCLCYIIRGTYSPVAFAHEKCILECNEQAEIVLFEYDDLFKRVYIKC